MNNELYFYDPYWDQFEDDPSLDGIGSFFKKIGKGIGKGAKFVAKKAAPIAVSFVPGVGQIASQGLDALLNRPGGQPDMDKKCAKSPKKKGCPEYLQQKQAALLAEQQQMQMQMQMQAQANSSQGDGFDKNTLLLVGGGVALVLVVMMMSKN